MSKFILFSFFFISFSGHVFAVTDKMALACNKTVEVNEITKTVVRLTPFRGVNLIFPEKIFNDSTVYSLSSDSVWSFTKATGTRIVPIAYKTMGDVFGEIQDFTVATEDHIYSIALVADPEIRNHCTNIIFKFSKAEEKRIAEKKKKASEAALKQQKKGVYSNLDMKVETLALDIVTKAVLSSPDTSKVFEESKFVLEDGFFTTFVDKIVSYQGVDILFLEIKNESPFDLNFNQITVVSAASKVETTVHGFIPDLKILKSGQSRHLHFSTRSKLDDFDDKILIVKTNKGISKVAF